VQGSDDLLCALNEVRLIIGVGRSFYLVVSAAAIIPRGFERFDGGPGFDRLQVRARIVRNQS
jgi:hypothetical protein